MSYDETDFRFELSIFENLLLQIKKLIFLKNFLGTSKLHLYQILFTFKKIMSNIIFLNEYKLKTISF
jgi:hypothetical protein